MSCRSLGAPESYPAVARRRYPQQVTGRLVPAVPGTVRSASQALPAAGDGAAGAGGARDSPLCLPLALPAAGDGAAGAGGARDLRQKLLPP
eukprot:12835-Pyramimonas_sp.AAC.1